MLGTWPQLDPPHKAAVRGRLRLARPEDAIMGTAGVGIAGDTFDRRMVQHGLSDHFGKNTTYDSGAKTLPMPAWIYAKLER